MAGFKVKFENILGGIGPSHAFSGPSQYDSAIGIDPDMPLTDSGVRVSGLLRPTAMSKFSGSNVSASPLWLMTNPKNSLVYAYMADGKFVSYTSGLASESLIGTPTSGAGNGGEYYDNYLYLATPTNVSRYGPLNGSPSITNAYWGTTLSKTTLSNTTYPTINGVSMPNHVMKYHAPKHALYFLDVDANNKLVVHMIKTSKNSVEGDTDNGSTYAALTATPHGYLGTCMESYGTDLAIGVVEGTDSTTLQSKAKILFWDTVATAPNKTVTRVLPDPLITAMLNVNGILYCWLGTANGGTRVIRFAGGYSWQEVAYLEETLPPMPGAVDHNLNRIVWGGNVSYPETAACVWAIGSKNAQLGASNPVHNILKATASGSSPFVSALKYAQQGTFKIRQPIVGWKDGSGTGIDKIDTTYGTNVWRSEVVRVGGPFQITKIRIPLAQAVAANMTIVPKIYVDELTDSATLQTINNTNYASSEKNITQKIENASGNHSFLLELRWTGSVLATVSLPITVWGNTKNDAAT